MDHAIPLLHLPPADRDAAMESLAPLLSGRVVVLVGACGGLGRLLAQDLARMGCRLVLGGRRTEPLTRLAVALCEHGGTVSAVACDPGRPGQVDRLTRAALRDFGHVDIWINTTGRQDQTEAPLRPFGPAWEDQGLRGMVRGTSEALSLFRRQGRGLLVNVGRSPGRLTDAQPDIGTALLRLGHAMEADLAATGHEGRVSILTILPREASGSRPQDPFALVPPILARLAEGSGAAQGSA